MEKILVDFTNSMIDEKSSNHLIDRDTLAMLLKSMDSEYDIDADTARRRITDITEIAKECDNALAAGKDLVRLHLPDLLKKKEQIQSQIREVNSTLAKNRNVWPEKRVKDLEESREPFEERLGEIENLLEKGDTAAVEKVRRAAKRRAGLLLEEHRVKRRKLENQKKKKGN